jgi:hypothetical protein
LGFDWADLLEVAQMVVQRCPSQLQEAALRTGISRAYYASFNHAAEYCRSQQRVIERSAGAHEQVRSQLRALGFELLASYLFEMHGWRKQVDYETVLNADIARMYMSAVATAHQVIKGLEIP